MSNLSPVVHMIMHTDIPNWDHNLRTFSAHFVYEDAEDNARLKNPGFETWGLGPTYLDSLKVQAQANINDTPPYWYAIDCGYDQPLRVNYKRADLMAKTLRRLDKYLAKMSESYGNHAGLGEYLARIGAHFSVTSYLVPKGSAGPFYNETDYRWMSAAEMRTWVEGLLK